MNSFILDAFQKKGNAWYYYNETPVVAERCEAMGEPSCCPVQAIYAPNHIGYRIDLALSCVGNSLCCSNAVGYTPVCQALEFGLTLVITDENIFLINNPDIVEMNNIYEV